MTAADKSPASADEIREICASVGRPSLAAGFIGRGLTAAALHAELTSGRHKAETDQIADMWARAFATTLREEEDDE